MDRLRSMAPPVIHWSYQTIDQHPTLVVEYADFQDLVPWRAQTSGFRIEIDGHHFLQY